MRQIVGQPNAQKAEVLAAEFEELIRRQRGAAGHQMVGENQHWAEVGTEVALPRGQAAEVIARGPVLPILVMLFTGREPPAFHVDQPRHLARRRNDEVEALERAAGDQAAAGFVDRDVRQPARAKKLFERGFVMVIAIGHGGSC